ncbi:uncharacterized protein LOC123872715 [Maniola jurtina]|uniref:uncharacterized protein LOC123872715 n=1 Tax=Maniola jurtina TaxID=191418 RepID=UPI001E68BDD8|nr:uncharacterized protein LOC123872715 [Maniola jurtina]
MKRTLFIILVVCTLSAMAAVPKLRRAIDPDEEENKTSSSSSPTKICAPQTPCGWSVYHPHSRIITTNITNTYCTCAPGTSCESAEDDLAASTYVLLCKKTPES